MRSSEAGPITFSVIMTRSGEAGPIIYFPINIEMINFLNLVVIVISAIVSFIVAKKRKENYFNCEDYVHWHSCLRSANGQCEWNKDKEKCVRKCTSYTEHNCDPRACRVINHRCTSK